MIGKENIFRFNKPTIIRDYLFYVEFGGALTSLDKNLCESVTLPDLGVGEEEMLAEFGGIKYTTPNHSAPQLEMVLLETHDSKVMNALVNMKHKVVRMDGSILNVLPLNDAKNTAKIKVVQYHMNGEVAREHTFHRCGISNASYGALSTDGTGAIKINVTFNVGKWTTQ